MVNNNHKPDPDLPKYMTKSDLEKFFKTVETHEEFVVKGYYDPVKYKAIFLLSYRYGLRRGEAVMLDVENIDLQAKTIYVKRLKRGVSKVYPLSDDLIPVIEDWLNNRLIYYTPENNGALFLTPAPNPHRLGSPAIAEMFRKLIGECGLGSKGYHFHSLRHSIAVHALEAGLHIQYVQDLLGHKSINSTMIYAKIMDTTRNKYMKNLSLSDSIARI